VTIDSYLHTWQRQAQRECVTTQILEIIDVVDETSQSGGRFGGFSRHTFLIGYLIGSNNS